MPSEIEKLITGHKKFREKFFNNHSTLFADLVEHGQKPKTMVIACADSRVNPAMIFDCQPGELFVIRNIANLIPPCEDNHTYHGISAALEFGACLLNVEHIIILGHTQCGGIRALLESGGKVDDGEPHSFITKWMELAKPAYDKIVAQHNNAPLEDKIILCEQYALVNSLQNLHGFPWIQQRVQNRKLSLHAWYFDLATGLIHRYEQDKDSWIVL